MCLEVSPAVLSELPHRLHSCPLSLTLVHFVLSCGPPQEVVGVCHPPILAEHDWRGVGFGTSPFGPFGKSFSYSNGVNSASADRVDTSQSASSFLFKGMTSPWGVANRNSRLQWVACKLPLASFISYVGTPFVTWRITSYSTSLHSVFHFPFPLKRVSFLQHCVSRASVELC